MSAIQKELVAATGVKPKKLDRQAFLKKLFKAAEALEEKEWEALSTDSQKWVNSCIDADDKQLKEYPEMPDYKGDDEPGAEDADAGGSDSAEAGDATEGEDKVATTEKKSKKSKKSDGKKAKAKTNGNDKPAAKKAKGAAKGGVGQKGDGYKGHRSGSNKEKAHKLYDDLGAEKAKPKVEALGMTKATIATWFNAFKKAGKAKK